MTAVTGIITSWSANVEPNIATRLRAAILGKPVEPGQGAWRLLLGLQLLFMMLGTLYKGKISLQVLLS